MRLLQQLNRIGATTFVLGVEPVAPAGAVTVHLPGAVIDIDPTRPDLLPSCLVGDVEWAGPGLARLFGDETVGAMLSMIGDSAPPQEEVAVAELPLLGVLRRLAEVRWVRQTSPVPFDPWLLDVEELLLLRQFGEILDEAEGWQDRLAGLVARLFRSESALTQALSHPLVAELVGQALQAIGGGMEAPVLRPGPLAEPAPPRIPEWSELLRPGLALAASEARLSGRCTVDWRDVAVGVTSRHEGNVAWRITLLEESASVLVEVAGISASWLLDPPGQPTTLRFDLLGEGLAAPILTGELTPGGLGQWRGEALGNRVQCQALRDLEAGGRQLRVRVRAADAGPAGNLVERAAQRWTSRGVVALRLHRIAGRNSYREAGITALQLAEQTWTAAKLPQEAKAVGELLALALDTDQGPNWPVTCTVGERVFCDSSG